MPTGIRSATQSMSGLLFNEQAHTVAEANAADDHFVDNDPFVRAKKHISSMNKNTFSS